MTNREKLFKMLGFPVALKPEPKVKIVKTESTKRKLKAKAVEDEQ
jgi:hypothetical protein